MDSDVVSRQVGVFLFVIISTFLDYSWADDVEEIPDCPDHDGGDKSSFTFTNEIMIVILVTVVATLIVSSVGFLLCICFCTCCCSVEEKAAEVPAPRPAKHDAGQAANSSRSREQPPESTGPSKTRFVIKVPGLGSFPIYGQVEPLSTTFRRPSPPKGKDSSGYKTRRKAGHANRALSPETDDEHYDGDGDFRDDVTTERFVRPPPPPSNLQPKPPTVSSKEFLQMQLEMSRIRANTYQCRNQVRQVNDGEVYRFENVQSY